MTGHTTEIAAPARPDETGLLARLRAGDDAAYAELVTAHAGRMLAGARRITRDDAEAEDAVQDAFLSAFRALPAFDGRSSLGTWLYRIAVNAALQRLRRRRARSEAPIEPLLPAFENGYHRDRPRAWRSGLDDAAAVEARDALRSAIDRLPDDFRTVLILRDIEGLESAAVAESLGISDAAVRQRLHRARLALVQLLDPTMTRPAP